MANELNKKLEELQSKANARSQGTQWTLDPLTGSFTATNTPSTREEVRPVTPQQASLNSELSSKEKPDFLTSMKTQMADIEALPSGDRLNALAALNGSASQFLAERQGAILTQAEEAAQVPQLRAALEESIQLDRNTPDYFAAYGTADSDETADVRRQLDSAIAASRQNAASMVSTDPTIAQVGSELDMWIKVQSQREAQSASQAQKIKDFGDNVKKVATILDPGATPDLVIKNVRKYEELGNLMQTPDRLLEAALSGKDPEPEILLPHVEAERIAGTSNRSAPEYQAALRETQDNVGLIKGILERPELFQEALEGSNLPKKVLDDWKSLQQLAGVDRSAAKQLSDRKRDFAIGYVETKAKDVFTNEVDTWRVTNEEGVSTNPFANTDTPLGTIYSNIRKEIGKDIPISVEALVAEMKKLPEDQRATADIQLKDAFNSARGNASKGMFGGGIGRLNSDIYINGLITQNAIGSKVSTDRAMVEGLLSGGSGFSGAVANIGSSLVTQQVDEFFPELIPGIQSFAQDFGPKYEIRMFAGQRPQGQEIDEGYALTAYKASLEQGKSSKEAMQEALTLATQAAIGE